MSHGQMFTLSWNRVTNAGISTLAELREWSYQTIVLICLFLVSGTFETTFLFGITSSIIYSFFRIRENRS